MTHIEKRCQTGFRSARYACLLAISVLAAVPAMSQVDRKTPSLKLASRSVAEVQQRLQQLLPNQIRLQPNSTRSHTILYTLVQGKATAILALEPQSNTVRFIGPEATVAPWRRVITAMDERPGKPNEIVTVTAWQRADKADIRKAVAQLAGDKGDGAARLVSRIFQQPDDVAPETADGTPPVNGPNDAPRNIDTAGGLTSDVQVEFVEGMDVIIIRGRRADVERVSQIVAEIERLSAKTKPITEIHPLANASSDAVAPIAEDVWEESMIERYGPISIRALSNPNAVLLVGRAEAVAAAKELVTQMDQDVAATPSIQSFPLSHMSAADAKEAIDEAFTDPQGIGIRVRATTNFRTNTVVVQGSPRDLAEVAKLVKQLDKSTSESSNTLRIFRLKNGLAADLATVIQDAINWQLVGSGTPTGVSGGGGGNTETQTRARLRSSMLSFMTVDGDNTKLLQSGILTDVRVTADERANALVVSGPSESMDLIGALIQELDQLPGAGAQIKVFTIINGDATRLANMLATLFGQTVATGQGGGQGNAQLPPSSATGAGESSLVPLSFGVDERTNSIIVSGNAGDLNVVEALLIRLDEDDIRRRKTTVYQLRNAIATEVAEAITELLNQQRQQLSQTEQQFSLVTPNDQIEREVFVVAEVTSNSVIVSATPRYYDEIAAVVAELDKRKPMVKLDILVAEVDLSGLSELGVELGFQDPVLFGRSATNVPNTSTPSLSPIPTIVPGFDFNNINQLPNSTAFNPSVVGGQGLSNFLLGRASSTAGFGGLVLSASSEAVNVLIRALERDQRIQILSRPHVTVEHNQAARLQVGRSIPTIGDTTINANTTTNSIEYRDIGIIMEVTPTVSPDGLIIVNFGIEKSDRAAGDDIQIPTGNGVATAPAFSVTEAVTVISARSGQTIAFSGLISTNDTAETRKVPYLGDLPLLGHLFRFDSVSHRRTELLIIMTPHLVQDEADFDYFRISESERMSWCLSDVVDLYGDVGMVGGLEGPHSVAPPPTIYPYEQPAAVDVMPSSTGNESGAKSLTNSAPVRLAPPIDASTRNHHGVDPKAALPQPQSSVPYGPQPYTAQPYTAQPASFSQPSARANGPTLQRLPHISTVE